jgi:PIN domain nuclease of toxin-antitoxin system
MSLLLDTHVVLWWLADDPGLSEEIKGRLDPYCQQYEVAILPA